MPAATTTTATVPVAPAPEPPQPQLWYRPTGEKVMEPFSSSITAAEHKIRNLEKRMKKIDQYRNDQAGGKTLNADQLAAVAKYNEVIQQLEHNRELVSCLRQVHQQTIKFIKQEVRREYAERNKFFVNLNAVLEQLQNPTVRTDLSKAKVGAQAPNVDELEELAELYKLVKPSLREPDYASKVETAAEIVSKLFESRGKINNTPSQKVKSLIDSLLESQYFLSGSTSSVPIEPVVEEVAPQIQETPNPHPVHVPEVPMGNNPVSAQLMANPVSTRTQEPMSYSFMQESQLKLEPPPQMDDPAVVAVSYGPTPQQIQPHPDNNHVFVAPGPAENLANIQPGMQNLGLNHVSSSNGNVEPEDWEPKTHQTGTFDSNSNGNIESNDQDNANGFERNGKNSFRGRGGGRGGRGGRGNGYGNGRVSKSGNRGGYSNNRGGYYRGPEGDAGEFRGKGGRGFNRPMRGNGNAPPSTGGPTRRGGGRGGAPKTFNGTHEPRSNE